MSKVARNIELLRPAENDLKIQYEELLRLRAKLTELLFPLKKSPRRKCRIMRSSRSTAKRNERLSFRAPQVIPGR